MEECFFLQGKCEALGLLRYVSSLPCIGLKQEGGFKELLPYSKDANLFVLQHPLGPLFFADKVANKFIQEFCKQEEMEGLENHSCMSF